MRFYRALLHCYPRSFRAEYGGEMTKDFAREWQSVHGLALLALLMTTVVDVAVNAARVHIDILVRDVKYTVRSLRRTPGFTITAILVAAIGIGATTATFSLADHVLIRPLPFPEPHRLVNAWQDDTANGRPRRQPSPPNFRDWQRQATAFERLEAYAAAGATMTGRGDAQRVAGAAVTPGMFQLLGRHAALGRILTEADATATERPIVISDGFWRTALAAPAVLGQTLHFDDGTFTVVGVMPPDFMFPSRQTNYWRPLVFAASNGDDDRGNNYLEVLGRLKGGVSLEEAATQMRAIGADLARAYPQELAGTSVALTPWRAQVGQQPRLLLLGLVAASLCVLLIACTNLANLLLSRALARRTEFAIRAAIGASVDRLARQMLTDSLVLALCGGALGIGLAITALPLLARLVPTALPIAVLPPIDLRMLVGTLMLTTLTGLTFGLAPALRVCRRADGADLKDGPRGVTSRGTERVRSGLVVAEITASVVLIVCVGLLTQALLAVQRVDPGFQPGNVLTLRTPVAGPKYAALGARLQFYSQVLTRIHALPGVQSASYISFLPLTMRGGIQEVLSTTPDPKSPEGFAPIDPGHTHSASLRFVMPRFFETVGTPILRGRDVSEADTMESALVAVVSESFARGHFPNSDPIGRSFAFAGGVRTIVGVSGDVKVRGLERASEPQVYLPAAQQVRRFFYSPRDLVVRATVPVATLVPAIRSIVAAVDSELPITEVQTMEQVVAGETAPRVAQLRVLGGFAVIALLLTAIGIHGLLAFTVSSRRREIGVRIALGARAHDVMWMIVGKSTVLALVGVILGSIAAYGAGRSMRALLFGIDPGDATTFAAAVSLSLLMALAGSILPAWRAIRVDPIAATRSE